MTAQTSVRTTQEIAVRYSEFAKQNRWDLILDELFDENAVSVEPCSSYFPNAEGLLAIRQKERAFNDTIAEMHGGWCSESVVGGNRFSVAVGMECTMKGVPGRTKMDEIAVYQVKNGKIVKEQFFY